MSLLRIKNAEAIGGFRLRLTLTDGRVIDRDVTALLCGPVFERIRSDPAEFASVRVEAGTVVWPGGADLCPDTLIWNGLPPEEDQTSKEPSRQPSP